MDIRSAGEDALIVYLGDSTNAETATRVQAMTLAIARVLGNDLVDLVPSYASILVVYKPLQTDHLSVKRRILECQGALADTASEESKLVTLPAWYDPESGPDLENLAHQKNLSMTEVIELHQAQEYRVYAIGFAPGFAYLGEVDERIAAPRLSTPRQKVPRGAIAIADRQTAVYPQASPGGWNLIGLCPTRLFDPDANPTMPVSVGDRVRFEAIDKQQFIALGGEL